jgi:serine/threonine-protein phosphatase PP1 catalytic subunit
MGVRPPLPGGEPPDANRLCVDLMWSDPAKAYQEALVGPDGFGQGQRGAEAICYGTVAVERFLERFGFNYVVRAHEPAETGIDVAKSGRVLTVFSTSKDHGYGDEASCGCLLVDGGKIIAINRDVATWGFVDPRDA